MKEFFFALRKVLARFWMNNLLFTRQERDRNRQWPTDTLKTMHSQEDLPVEWKVIGHSFPRTERKGRDISKGIVQWEDYLAIWTKYLVSCCQFVSLKKVFLCWFINKPVGAQEGRSLNGECESAQSYESHFEIWKLPMLFWHKIWLWVPLIPTYDWNKYLNPKPTISMPQKVTA